MTNSTVPPDATDVNVSETPTGQGGLVHNENGSLVQENDPNYAAAAQADTTGTGSGSGGGTSGTGSGSGGGTTGTGSSSGT
jgi:hypothetical protein